MDTEAQSKLVTALAARSSAVAASSLRPSVLPVRPGLYSWWADEGAMALLKAVLQVEVTQPVYIGQAGAGGPSATLASRILRNHLGSRRERSTFRRTIGALLDASQATEDDRRPVSEAEISEWMRDHLSVVVVPLDNRELVAATEDAALRAYDPPLNLKGMASSEARRLLRRLRAPLAIRASTEAAWGDHPGAPSALQD